MAGTAHLLFDSVSRNTGDIAIGIANAQAFSRVGIDAEIVDPFSASKPKPVVVGGGELIRTTGDQFYDLYRVEGEHILNAAGVWQSANDLAYLREYAFVSGRSRAETDVLQRWVPDAVTVACTTTTLQSDRYVIPGLDDGEPAVGIHLVPHTLRMVDDLVEAIDAIPHKKVIIPFTHYNFDASFMRSLPIDRSNVIELGQLEPLELHSVIGQMRYVVVSSLHASIFAYSQNVPFASAWQQKVDHYFSDRDLGSLLFRNRADLDVVLERLENESFDFSGSVAADVRSIEESYERYAEILRSNSPGSWGPPPVAKPRPVDLVLLEQAQAVIVDRDHSIASLESARVGAVTEVRRLEAELESNRHTIDQTRARLHAAESQLHRLRSSPLFRLARNGARLLRHVRSAFARR